jgi:hypothetical protein
MKIIKENKEIIDKCDLEIDGFCSCYLNVIWDGDHIKFGICYSYHKCSEIHKDGYPIHKVELGIYCK